MKAFPGSMAVVCAFFLASLAFAGQGKAAQNVPLTPAEQGTLQILEELHHTRALLNQADHDYKGHRHHAAKEIGQAIHQLQQSLPKHHHHHLANVGKNLPKKQGNNLPQAQSDALLQQARGQLKTVEMQLSQFQGPLHQKALVDVARGVEQIDAALKIR